MSIRNAYVNIICTKVHDSNNDFIVSKKKILKNSVLNLKEHDITISARMTNAKVNMYMRL